MMMMVMLMLVMMVVVTMVMIVMINGDDGGNDGDDGDDYGDDGDDYGDDGDDYGDDGDGDDGNDYGDGCDDGDDGGNTQYFQAFSHLIPTMNWWSRYTYSIVLQNWENSIWWAKEFAQDSKGGPDSSRISVPAVWSGPALPASANHWSFA